MGEPGFEEEPAHLRIGFRGAAHTADRPQMLRVCRGRDRKAGRCDEGWGERGGISLVPPHRQIAQGRAADLSIVVPGEPMQVGHRGGERRLDAPARDEETQQALLPSEKARSRKVRRSASRSVSASPAKTAAKPSPSATPRLILRAAKWSTSRIVAFSTKGSCSSAWRMSVAIRKAKLAEHQKVGSRNTTSISRDPT